jgi:hypothetical protein
MVEHLFGGSYVAWLGCIRWGVNPECGRWVGNADPDTGWIGGYPSQKSRACPGTDAYPPPVAPLTKCQRAKQQVKSLKYQLSIAKGKAQRARIERLLKRAKLHGKRVCHPS